ncbi:MAG: ABC transporter ATP-binding protein [Bacteroidia bacterium]|nr:ABC transporter ATP-binding protein [Bacteroidia bacterium]
MQLTLDSINIGYPQKHEDLVVCEGIQFSANAGDLVGVIGSNGIGKSTFLRTLAGLQPPLKGAVSLDGKNIAVLSPKDLSRQISVVLTDPIATKNLTVRELISLGRQPYTNWLGTLSKDDLIKINQVLSMLQLEDIQNRICYELSDGQLQRVMIGRALAQDTPVIILDEPTMHLDLVHKVQLLKLLGSIASELQKLIVFSTHEINLAIQLCSHLLVMTKNDTRFGSPDALIKNDSLQQLFPQKEVYFDPKSKSFTFEATS